MGDKVRGEEGEDFNEKGAGDDEDEEKGGLEKW